jgi:hypothetical protein
MKISLNIYKKYPKSGLKSFIPRWALHVFLGLFFFGYANSSLGQKTELEKSWEVGLSKPMFSYINNLWWETGLNTNPWPGLIVRRKMERLAFTSYLDYHDILGDLWNTPNRLQYGNIKISLHTYIGKKRLKLLFGTGLGYSYGNAQIMTLIDPRNPLPRINRASLFLDLGLRYDLFNKLCITLETAGNAFVNMEAFRISPNLAHRYFFDYFPLSHLTIAYTLPAFKQKN